MPHKEKRPNLTEVAYDTLRRKILSGQLAPGTMLGEVALAQELNMSRTPLREALKMLKRDDLLEIRDGVGTFVKTVTRQEIRDAYELRKALELLAVQTAIRHITSHELEPLRQQFLTILGKLRADTPVSVEEYAQADWALHDLIIQRCENVYVRRVTGEMSAILRRYQSMSVEELTHAQRSLDEHLQILDALDQRNLPLVRTLLEEHIQY